ncbi:MAG: GNAT family N-acetyltransferase [Beijerinckiaceae bacterium]
MVRTVLALPAIETARLRLRPLGWDDADAFRAMSDEPAITDVIDFLHTPFTLFDARKLIIGENDRSGCFWGIWLREDVALIGTVGAHLQDADEIEIGYWLASSMHGQGFGSEAVSAVVRGLARAYPERCIFAECRPQNKASWHLLEKIGFRADGRNGLRSGRKRLVLRGSQS